MKTHFHMKGCAPRLALKKRYKTTQKWPVVLCYCNVVNPTIPLQPHTQTEFYKTLYNQNELRIYFNELRVIFITTLITFIPWTVLATCETNDWLRAFVILHSPTLHYLKLAAVRKFNSLMTVGVMKRWDLFFKPISVNKVCCEWMLRQFVCI